MKQPSYDGRSLSSWLREFDDSPLDGNAPACEAIRAMGSNAVPYLVERIVDRDPKWRIWLRKRFRSLNLGWFGGSPSQVARVRASNALRALGGDAAPALPLLILEVRKDPQPFGSPWVGLAAIVDGVPETITVITNELTAPRFRPPCTYFVGMHSTNAAVAVPFLMKSAQDPYWWTRYYAVMGLRRFGPQAAVAEPVVRKLLNDGNAFVSNEAASALKSINSSSKVRNAEDR